MFSTSFVNKLKKINKDLYTKVRPSERDGAPRYEVWHVDAHRDHYVVRAWSQKELEEELKVYGWKRIVPWFEKAEKVRKAGKQEQVTKDMQERNQKRRDDRHKKKLDEIREVASSSHVRNVFKDLAEATGL